MCIFAASCRLQIITAFFRISAIDKQRRLHAICLQMYITLVHSKNNNMKKTLLIILLSVVSLFFFLFLICTGGMSFASFGGRELSASELSSDSIVDLGLSVKWKNYNEGAATITDCGKDCMWDSVKGKMTECIVHRNDSCSTTEYAEFRLSSNSVGRYPTSAEFKELIEKCKWERVMVDDTEGLLVTGPNKNKIFFPSDCYYQHPETYAHDQFGCVYAAKNNSNSFDVFTSFWEGSDGYNPTKEIRNEGTSALRDSISLATFSDLLSNLRIRLVVDSD